MQNTGAPDVRPLDVDGVGAVAVGTVLWAIALVVTLLMRDRLVAAGNDWWIWVCVSGVALGLIGLPYVIRRRNAYRSAGAGSSESSSSSDSSASSDS